MFIYLDLIDFYYTKHCRNPIMSWGNSYLYTYNKGAVEIESPRISFKVQFR